MIGAVYVLIGLLAGFLLFEIGWLIYGLMKK